MSSDFRRTGRNGWPLGLSLCASLVDLGWKPSSASSWLGGAPQSPLWMKTGQDEPFAPRSCFDPSISLDSQ